MKTAMPWKMICLTIVLALVLNPGVCWSQPPAAKQDVPVEKDEATPEEPEENEASIKPGPNPMNVATDILILRPVGLVMIPVTAIIYVIGYPFAAASGTQEETYQSLVGNTIEYTFERPLGEGAPFE